MNMITLNLNPKHIRLTVILSLLAGCLFGTTINAHQFRSLNPIATPSDHKQESDGHNLSVEEIEPVDREVVENSVRDLISKWNTAEMSSTIADSFFDKSRLMDNMDSIVPREAKLRVQSIQGIQTVQQFIEPAQNSERNNLVSIVSVTVRTQLEFNDPTLGFVRRNGTNEFILKVTQAAPP